MSQDQAFIDGEGDAWFLRNPISTTEAGLDDPVLAALDRVELSSAGKMLDVGGAAGRIAAGFLRQHPGWEAVVLDPSSAAIEAGQKAFPGVTFRRGSIASTVPEHEYDVVIVSGVLCWVDRSRLARAIANIDTGLRDGGLLFVADFHPEAPRANPYSHRPGLFTYKQDYSACFTSLGTYRMLGQYHTAHDTPADVTDPFDVRYAVWVLRKDLEGAYARC
jgi:SAM-dependent methyltransferase